MLGAEGYGYAMDLNKYKDMLAELQPGEELEIGREKSTNETEKKISIPEGEANREYVSDHHLTIRSLGDGKLLIQDHSTNGTTIKMHRDLEEQAEKVNYDEYTLFDLRKEFEAAHESGDQKKQDDILAYIDNYWSKSKLDENNAAVFYDYVQILQTSGRDVAKDDLKAIDAALAQYDENNGLDKIDITPEQYQANLQAWEQYMAAHDCLAKELPGILPEEFDDQTRKEAYDVLKTSMLQQLALESPSDNAEEVLRQKMNDVVTPYQTKLSIAIAASQEAKAKLDKKRDWAKEYHEATGKTRPRKGRKAKKKF